MSDLPKAVMQITSDDNGDCWAVLQRCAGDADYYVEMGRYSHQQDAVAIRDWIITDS